jgi:hypothetical protein
VSDGWRIRRENELVAMQKSALIGKGIPKHDKRMVIILGV